MLGQALAALLGDRGEGPEFAQQFEGEVRSRQHLGLLRA